MGMDEMKCPKCGFDNRETAKFCKDCGEKLEFTCPRCGEVSNIGSKFCDNCGQKLEQIEREKEVLQVEGERKYVTVLFSDLSGYTAMSEKLDPEEVKETMSRIFGEIAQVVTKYEGFIEKFVGDAVMALFGVPKAHEDDPIRAIKVAREINELVHALSPEIEKRIGQTLSMHTGINTGLVVTGKVNMEKGTYGIAGDTINLASRLSELAKPGEILVGLDTYRQAEGHFAFETLRPTRVKGKAEPIQVYKFLSAKEKPVTLHRLSGLRADLIGRKVEIAHLVEAVDNLRKGKGAIFSIYGNAGSGKSRLVEEFKKRIDLREIRWHEGHAYAYSKNFPYFPLIDLLNRAFEIEEGDPPEKVRKKIETNIHVLLGEEVGIAPFVGSLYALKYTEVEQVNPETWKSYLQQAIQRIFSALAQKYPTVICLEDLHWADPSSLDLLRFILQEARYPALFLCIFRTPFNLFTTAQLSALGNSYHEIRLEDLSPSETQDMMESILKTESIPPELLRFVQEKIGGNPFYLEELVNSLIDLGTLTHDERGWRLSRTIHDSDVPSTIKGVITARLDLLDEDSKRIVREASVIGRVFLYEILKRITDTRDQVDQCLRVLERLDLIRTRSFHPELEYIFKHALTHEVIYNGLLLKERREIHEQIAFVIERLFERRLAEFYETLAFHFEQGKSIPKATHYLIKSGEKSLNRYSVQESHHYFKRAFEKMTERSNRTREENERIIDLLIKWAFVFHYRGDFRGLKDILSAHENLAKSLDDKPRLGMLYTQLGLAYYQTENIKGAYQCLQKALELGENTKNDRVIGYACSHLSWVCPELGLIDDSLEFGKKGIELSKLFQSDDFLYFNSLGGMGLAYYYKGDRKKVLEVGKGLLAFAREHTNIRSLVLGHFFLGCSHIISGDFSSSITCLRDAIKSSADPWFSQFPRLLLGFSYLSTGLHEDAEEAIKEIFDYSLRFGTDIIKTPARILEGVLRIIRGNLSEGLKILEDAQQQHLKNERRYIYATAEDIIGRIYLQIVEGVQPNFSLFKNIGFLIRNVPSAGRRAEKHFNNAIKISEQIGAVGILGIANLNLGLFYRRKGKKDQAHNCILKAITCFEKCEAEAYLKEAREALGSI